MIGSLISGAANIAGTIFGNKQNQKINQMNNEFNAREAAKNREFQTSEREAQNAWNLEQWNRENEYNSASAQRKRLQEAGLNPYLMMDGGSAGSASPVSVSGQSPGSQASAAHPVSMKSPQFDYSTVIDAINSFYQNKKLAADTTGQNIFNQMGNDFYASQIAQNLGGKFEWLTPEWQSGRKGSAMDLLGIDVNTARQKLESVKAYTELTTAQESLTYLKASAQKTMNKYLDNQQQADLWIKSSQIFTNFTQGKMNEAEAIRAISQASLNTMNTKVAGESYRAAKRDNKIADGLASDLFEAMQTQYRYNREWYDEMRKYARSGVHDTMSKVSSEARLKELESKMAPFERIIGNSRNLRKLLLPSFKFGPFGVGSN